MSDITEDVDSPTLDPPIDGIDIKTVIEKYLEFNPNPTDENVHSFASALGLDFKEFEALIYKLFGSLIDETEDQELLEELEPEDPLDMFLLNYFLFNSTPTDDQIHALATLVGEDHQMFEERVYRMMTTYFKQDDSEVEAHEFSNSGEIN